MHFVGGMTEVTIAFVGVMDGGIFHGVHRGNTMGNLFQPYHWLWVCDYRLTGLGEV